jgi:alanyl-tRNA synthetase
MDSKSNQLPQTTQIYYQQPYLTELNCQVTRLEEKGSQHMIELDHTIFYPEGGGQPSDQGELAGPNGKFRVEQVRTIMGGHIIHQGKLSGQLNVGDEVKATIKWPVRHKNMRQHSAGHLIHDVLMTLVPGLTPTKGNHGQKAFLQYLGVIDPGIKSELEAKIDEAIKQDLPIITRDTTYDEIAAKCRFIPSGLPRDKRLRLIQIGTFDPMPDGGVQVQSTGEIGKVILHSISPLENETVIRYGIAN